ncbi:MAG: hypothetical protein P8J50_01810 [Acidimicrobiales bacterium]|nr:hypothetical protein [Acidimicrobiales bacterium]
MEVAETSRDRLATVSDMSKNRVVLVAILVVLLAVLARKVKD